MPSIASILRSSHRRCSVRKGVLRNFAKFTGKNLCQSLFFNKVAGLCFPVNFANFLRTPFRQNTSGRLLLYTSSDNVICLSTRVTSRDNVLKYVSDVDKYSKIKVTSI